MVKVVVLGDIWFSASSTAYPSGVGDLALRKNRAVVWYSDFGACSSVAKIISRELELGLPN
jgi:hypothetical protein